MALTNIELYEELKKTVTEEAARMIAEVVPKANDLATKGDIARLESKIDRFELVMKGEIAASEKRQSERLLTYFVPLWIAVFGALGTMIALVIAR